MPRITDLIRGSNDIKTTLDKSDFDFQDISRNSAPSHVDNEPDLIDFDDDANDDNKITKQEYRTAYPLDETSMRADRDFLKSLESKN